MMGAERRSMVMTEEERTTTAYHESGHAVVGRSVPKADPVSIVRFLIEQQHLTQRELIPQFGSESAVSMFMTGQRNLTLEQVRKLSTRFKLPTDVFIPKTPVEQSPKRPTKGHSRSR